jgi:hypothetical protein
LTWRVDGEGFVVHVVARRTREPAGNCAEIVGATCLSATLGVSRDHHGNLEVAAMQAARRDARSVEIVALESSFIESFRSAAMAPSYLVEHMPVTWTRGELGVEAVA